MPGPAHSRKLILAGNPRSGRGRGRAVSAMTERVFTAAGHEVIRLEGHDEPELRQLIAGIDPSGVDGVIVVGGDGTVHTVINSIPHAWNVPVGIIPAGTGNDIAMALGYPRTPEATAHHLLDALRRPPQRIDLGSATHSEHEAYFAAVYSAGFDAIVNERANAMAYPKGPSRYTVALAAELTRMRPRRYRLSIDGTLVECEALLVAVANGPSFGGGMQVVPHASMTDGQLDVLIVGPVSRGEFIRIYPRVFSGAHLTHPAVDIRPARTVIIESRDIVGYADGERQDALPVTIEVQPLALSVFR